VQHIATYLLFFPDFFGRFEKYLYLCHDKIWKPMKQEASVKPYLIEKLKQEHCLWSYDNDSIHDMPDDVLIELVMLYLDIDEINMLFSIFSYKKMKKAWIENVVAQGERYYNLNYFFAWYYFHAKRPRSYVKAMATRQLNKRLAA
jgi:hypothetical protein